MIATERTNSGLLAFVSSGLRAFAPSRLHAFVSPALVLLNPVPCWISERPIPYIIQHQQSDTPTTFYNISFIWSSICILKVSKVSLNPADARPYSLPWELRWFSDSLLPIADLTCCMSFPFQGLLSCEKHYREALRLRPHFVAAWENLGLVLLNTSKNL